MEDSYKLRWLNMLKISALVSDIVPKIGCCFHPLLDIWLVSVIQQRRSCVFSAVHIKKNYSSYKFNNKAIVPD